MLLDSGVQYWLCSPCEFFDFYFEFMLLQQTHVSALLMITSTDQSVLITVSHSHNQLSAGQEVSSQLSTALQERDLIQQPVYVLSQQLVQPTVSPLLNPSPMLTTPSFH